MVTQTHSLGLTDVLLMSQITKIFACPSHCRPVLSPNFVYPVITKATTLTKTERWLIMRNFGLSTETFLLTGRDSVIITQF